MHALFCILYAKYEGHVLYPLFPLIGQEPLAKHKMKCVWMLKEGNPL